MTLNKKGTYLMAAGLLFLFASCEKDIAEGYGEGKRVEIFFSVNTTNYQAGGDVVRNAGARGAESTTMYINDSLYLQTTLVPDEEEELRAPTAFKEGQKLCFAAFLTNGTQVGTTAIYTYSGGKWTPVGDPLGVTPDNSTVYRFVAYSYFDETGTPPTDNSTIDPIHDLVWGMSVNTKIEDDTEAARTVSINMTHKFARVKVVVKSGITGANITALSGVEIDGGQLATLTPFDGGISWSGTVTQGVDPFTVNSTKERESGYRTVKPMGAGSLKVKIENIKISSATAFTNQTVSFNPALSAATSYTLVVNLKRCNWARSNIYWDGNKLTFVPAGNDLSKQGYQGVFFRWGSLVGISPVESFSSSTTILYTSNAIVTGAYSSWGAIPCESDVSKTALDAPNTTTLTGDICKQINSGYRMPVYGEFGPGNGWDQNGWVKYENSDFSGVTTDKEDGTYDFIANGASCAKNTVKGDVIFPASGLMDTSNGSVSGIGSRGIYWCCTASNGTNGYILTFAKNYLYDYASGARTFAFSVRCVQDSN